MINSGIYFIKNLKNNKLYVGSAQDFDVRWYRHKRELNLNIHHCQLLQEAWNEDGCDSFIFERVEYVNKELLIKAEQIYLDNYWDGGVNCYNKCRIAGSWYGNKHTDETKKQLSFAKQGSNNVGSKLTEQDVLQIKQHLFDNKLMIKEIAAIFNIDKTNISKMVNGERWIHCFTDEEREQLQQLQKQNKKQRFLNNNPMNDPIILEKNKEAHRGENHSQSILTTDNVIEIKKMINAGEKTNSIAQLFNVHASTISHIKSGKRWPHIKIV